MSSSAFLCYNLIFLLVDFRTSELQGSTQILHVEAKKQTRGGENTIDVMGLLKIH